MRAIDSVKADPNLGTERTIKMLRWKDSATKGRSRTRDWLAWLAGLFRWLDQSARVLVWCAGVLAAGLLVVFMVRLGRRRAGRRRDEPMLTPTHVRDLDIRPESLPADIGRAARLLWDGGEHRAALALLYRGMLSRLAHAHRLPIRESSTEGDCLRLAAAHLTPARREYVSRLIGVWQRCVYGRQHVQAAAVHALCDEFASALDPTPESVASGSAA